MSATTLNQCSRTNRNKLCRKGFSTTTNESLVCLTSLFYEYGITGLRNCLVDSVLLPEASQASYLADGLYHVISRTACLQIKRDTNGLHVAISTLQCRSCFIRPSCSSTLTFNHEILVFTPDMGFCETRPEPFVASMKLIPSLAAVFNNSPSAERVLVWRGSQRNCFYRTVGAETLTTFHENLGQPELDGCYRLQLVHS